MSFILDALRKSENKRSSRQDDEVRAVYEAPAPKPPKSRLWVIVLTIVLLFNLLLVLWMTSVWRQPSVPAPVVQLPPTTASTIAVPPRPKPSVVAPAMVTPEVSEPATGAPLQVPMAAVEPVAAVEIPSVEIPAIEPPVVTDLPPSAATAPQPSAAEAVTAAPLNAISELPASLRARVATLQMALHAYNANNPAASMVQIDGRLLRAGGRIDSDLLLEEITAEGVILSSGDYRFLLPRRGQ